MVQGLRSYSIALVLLFSIPAFADIPRIACVGDSLTDSDYPKFLQDMCGDQCVVKSWAKKGATMHDISFLAMEALGVRLGRKNDFKPTHIVIYGGINDCLNNPKAFIKGISRGDWTWLSVKLLVQLAIDNHVIPIVVAHHGWARKSSEGSRCSEDFNAHAYDSDVTRIVDTSELSSRGVLKKIYDGGDGLHLNRRGYRELARLVFNKLFPSCFLTLEERLLH